MAVGTLYPNGSNAADKAASTSGGKTEKTAGDKPCDENGMGKRVLLKEGRVGQGGVKAAGRGGNNMRVEFKAWGLGWPSGGPGTAQRQCPVKR